MEVYYEDYLNDDSFKRNKILLDERKKIWKLFDEYENLNSTFLNDGKSQDFFESYKNIVQHYFHLDFINKNKVFEIAYKSSINLKKFKIFNFFSIIREFFEYLESQYINYLHDLVIEFVEIQKGNLYNLEIRLENVEDDLIKNYMEIGNEFLNFDEKNIEITVEIGKISLKMRGSKEIQNNPKPLFNEVLQNSQKMYEEYQEILKKLNETNLYQNNVIQLNNSIKKHIKFVKRNTENFEKTLSKIKDFILNVSSLRDKVLSVQPFGSFTQYSYNIQSDLEISIQIPIDENYSKFLESLYQELNDCDLFTNIHLRSTKKLSLINLIDKDNNVNIEIMVNNHLPIYNSSLIKCYSLIDKNLIILNNIIKDWSKINEINGNFKGYLCSYVYSLMVIFFFQKGFKEPLLPNLQASEFINDKIIIQSKDSKDYISHYNLNFDPENIMKKINDKYKFVENENNLLPSELLIKFFEFYLFYFDEENYYINISSDETLKRFECAKTYNYYFNDRLFYSVMDPFEYNHVPSSYFNKKSNFDNFKNTMFETLISMVSEGKIF